MTENESAIAVRSTEIMPVDKPQEKQKTLGEHRMRIDYNNTIAYPQDEFKHEIAKLIDKLQKLNENDLLGIMFTEKQRLIALAQTHLETASMFATKAFTC